MASLFSFCSLVVPPACLLLRLLSRPAPVRRHLSSHDRGPRRSRRRSRWPGRCPRPPRPRHSRSQRRNPGPVAGGSMFRAAIKNGYPREVRTKVSSANLYKTSASSSGLSVTFGMSGHLRWVFVIKITAATSTKFVVRHFQRGGKEVGRGYIAPDERTEN